MKEKRHLDTLDKVLLEKYQEGVHQLERGEFTEAEGVLMEVHNEAPGFVPAHNKLAIIYIYQNELDRAREWLQKALNSDQEFAPALTNLGSIYKNEGKKEKAKELYQRAIEIDPDYGPAYNNLGVIYREEKNYTESISYLKKANKLRSYSIDTKKEKPIYKEWGCLIPILLIALLVYWIFKH
jgi:Tfp pilus assembly protein PilF